MIIILMLKTIAITIITTTLSSSWRARCVQDKSHQPCYHSTLASRHTTTRNTAAYVQRRFCHFAVQAMSALPQGSGCKHWQSWNKRDLTCSGHQTKMDESNNRCSGTGWSILCNQQSGSCRYSNQSITLTWIKKGILQPMLAPITPPKRYPTAMPTVGNRYRMPNHRVFCDGGATSSIKGPA